MIQKSFSQCYSGQSVPCHTPSPHTLIPPPTSDQGWRCGYSNVGKILIKSVAALRVWLRRLWLHLPFRKIPVSRYPPMKLEQKVALCAANKIGHHLPAFACQTSCFHFRLFISSLCALPTVKFEIGFSSEHSIIYFQLHILCSTNLL
jgi:hypothetical protein